MTLRNQGNNQAQAVNIDNSFARSDICNRVSIISKARIFPNNTLICKYMSLLMNPFLDPDAKVTLLKVYTICVIVRYL